MTFPVFVHENNLDQGDVVQIGHSRARRLVLSCSGRWISYLDFTGEICYEKRIIYVTKIT